MTPEEKATEKARLEALLDRYENNPKLIMRNRGGKWAWGPSRGSVLAAKLIREQLAALQKQG